MQSAAPLERHHSRVDSAWAWLNAQLGDRQIPPVIAFIGLGEGHVLDALQQHAPDTRVLALEPDPTTARAFLAGGTFRRWQQGDRLIYLVGPDYAGADEAWRVFAGASAAPPVLLHPGLTLTPAVARAAQVLKKILVGVAANHAARRKFASRYLVNVLRNLPAIVAGSDLRHLRDGYRGIPAVVAGAGPSLDAALPELQDVRNRALLVACDTALRPLLAAGITPQLAVGVDPSDRNARHLLSLPECSNTWLVAESALDRSASAVFDDRTFWFQVSNHEPWPWLQALGLDVGKIDVWGSVLTAAFQVACLAGCDPIVIVGADLAFTDGRPYARGTTYELDWAVGTASGMALEDVWRSQLATKVLTSAPDVQGRDTTTTASLLSFRDWMVARAARSGRRVVNAGGAGVFAGDGIEQGRLRDALSGTFAVPDVSAFARRHAGLRPTRLAMQIREAHAVVARDLNHPLVASWKAFSGEGYDRTLVIAALDEAARGLENKRRRPPQTPIVEWARLERIPAAYRLAARLPEAVARLRAALNGETPPAIDDADTPTAEDRPRLLLEALRLLARIRGELAQLRDLPVATIPQGCERLPASARYAWPDSLRWAVEVYEGLLGMAWGGEPGSAQAFYGAPVAARDEESVDRKRSVSSAVHAGVLLVREWLECRASIEPNDETRDTLARLAGAEPVTKAAGLCADGNVAAFVLTARGEDVSVELPLPFHDKAAGRLRTGELRFSPASVANAASWLPRVELDDVAVSIAIDRCDDAAGLQNDVVVMRPRVLSRRGERWSIAYDVEEGVVCVRANDTSSVIVRPDGSMRPHLAWPRPILSELPFGDGGAVAWASGRAMRPLTEPYVMYRGRRDDAPAIDDLPFTPTWGTWWNDRLYWGYLPASGQTGRGLGSWAPGEGARIDVAGDFALFGLHADGRDLLIEPATRREDFSYVRCRVTTGWRFTEHHLLEPRTLDSNGAAGSRVVGHGWTTTTFPEADVVVFERGGGPRVSMTVYYPFRAAWLGTSLLVGTVDQQLLLFEGLADRLAAFIDS